MYLSPPKRRTTKTIKKMNEVLFHHFKILSNVFFLTQLFDKSPFLQHFCGRSKRTAQSFGCFNRRRCRRHVFSSQCPQRGGFASSLLGVDLWLGNTHLGCPVTVLRINGSIISPIWVFPKIEVPPNHPF